MNPPQTLHIVESELRRRAVERQSFEQRETERIETGDTLTLSAFFSRMITQSDIPSTAPGWLQFVAMRRAAGLDPSDEQEPLFPQLSHPTRLIRRLLRIRYVLGMARVSPDQLSAAYDQWSANLTPLHRKLPRVLSRYVSYLEEEQVRDRPGQLEMLMDHAGGREQLPAPFKHISEIDISQLDHLRELEFQLLKTLLDAVEHASVEFSYNPDREEAFMWALPTLEKFEEAGLTMDTVDPAFRLPEDTSTHALAQVRERIFREPPTLKQLDPIPPDESMRFYEAGDPVDERQTVANLVRQKLEDGIPPSDICVVTTEHTEPTELVEQLRDVDVPVMHKDTGFAPFDPGILGVLLPVQTAVDGWERDDVLDLLRHRLLDGPADIDPEGLEDVFREAGITRDHPDQWRNRLTYTSTVLERRLDAYASSSDDRSFFPDNEETERQRKQHTDRFLDDMDDLFEALSGVAETSTFQDLIHHIQTCMDRFDIPSALFASSSTPDVDLSLYRSISAFRSFLDRVQTGLQQVHLTTRFETSRALLTFFKQVWSQDEANQPSWTGPSDGVRLLTPDEMTGLSFQHVVVPKMNEGVWPQPVHEDPFLTDELITEIRRVRERAVLQLTSQKRHRQLYQFHQVLSSADERVDMTWSRMDAEGTEQLPSPFLEDIKKLLTELPVRSPRSSGDGPADTDAHETPAEHRFTDRDQLIHLTSGAEEPTDQSSSAKSSTRDDALQSRIDHVLERQRLSVLRDRFFLEADPERRTQLAGPWSGVVSDQEQFRHLLTEQLDDFDTDRWSPTALERYAQCPYAYFSERILELDDEDRPALGMDRRREGLLLHEIMRRLYETGPHSGAPMDDDQINDGCEQVFEQWEYYGFHGEQAFWEVKRERLRLQVRQVVKFLERKRSPDTEVRPEVSFGEHGSMPPLEFESSSGETMRIEGRIDRLERSGAERRAVLDYKNVARRQKYRNFIKLDEFGVRSFQIPAYLLAVAGESTEAYDNVDRWESGFITMRERRGKPELVNAFLDPEEQEDEDEDPLETLQHALMSGTRDIVERILNGHFEVTPDPCQSGCPYRGMCRYEDLTTGD